MQQQIRDWLNECGMAQYAEAFCAQNVDLAILPDLTEQDLKDLGVLLGDRRKILAWGAGLKRASSAPEGADGEPGPSQSQSNLGERRQVTVLFCDLVDSTGLSRKLDPEDLRAVIRAYQEAVSKAIRQYDGFVAGFRGDGVLVYFGYPNAHEDDAERAVRAALDLISAVGTIPSAAPLETRVGIATGLVVVGDLIGTGDTQERNMVGDTPNLAARLLALAEPDSVVIADETRGMLGGFFELEDLGPRPVKGIEHPVRSWAVLRSRAVESRFDAMHMAALTAFSGREDELDLLLKRWRRAKDGEGQVVLISGEPGIGKSRLTAALMEETGAEPQARLRYFCSPQHTDSAFYPIIAQMERAAGFAHDDNPDEKLDKLDALLSSISATLHDRALIAGLLSLSNERYPLLDYDAAQLRAKTMEALHAQVVTLCARGPVLMILEDAHWIDPTTLEAFGRMVERLKRLQVMLVITYRPEFAAPWIGESHVTAMTLNRLGDRDAAEIVLSLLGNKVLPADVMSDIVERSDGIPLFIEEMTKAVHEAESEGDAKRVVAAAPSHKSAVPASLHASLMARLDRLGAAKGIAQAGAAIGRSFTHALLAAVADDSPDDLRIYLDRLIASGLLFRQGLPPDATYLFKHALIRDAAYSMLLREPRRALHARILEALETKFPDIAENQPELLAHHASAAGQIAKAAELWGKAGQRSLYRSTLIEAVAQLSHAIELSEHLPTTTELRQRQIELQVSLAMAVMQTKGYAAPDTIASFNKARELIEHAESLGEKPNDPLSLFMSLYGLWVSEHVNFNRDEALRLATRFLNLARAQEPGVALVIGHRLMGSTLMFAGEIVEARNHFDRAIEFYSAIEHRSTSLRFGLDTSVAGLSYRSHAQWLLGFPSAANSDSASAVSQACSIGHETTLLLALGYRANTLLFCGDYGEAAAVIDELLARSDVKGAQYWKAAAILYQGRLHTLLGNDWQSVELTECGIASWRSAGATVFTPFLLPGLALSYARLGQFAEAKHWITEAVSSAKSRNENWCNSFILHTAGEIELLSNELNIGKALAYFEQALVTAREQCAKSWELRAATSLARLWREQAKPREAHDLLAPVYQWFTEGFDTLDLKQAKALLDELRAELRIS